MNITDHIDNLPLTNKDKWYGHETIFYMIHVHNHIEYFTINKDRNVHKFYVNPLVLEGIEIIYE